MKRRKCTRCGRLKLWLSEPFGRCMGCELGYPVKKPKRKPKKRRVRKPSAHSWGWHLKHLGPACEHKCKRCGEQAAHWHHTDGYEPENIGKVVPLCASCHVKIHGRMTPEYLTGAKGPPDRRKSIPSTSAEPCGERYKYKPV